ncbi:MAG: Uma2 family endonuclease [Blautia sp.]|nr:Uma2 family endonuclease [Blautia sp.]
MRERKKELGYSYETIARLSGLPLGTVQKVLGGITQNPRQATLEALTKVLRKAPSLVRDPGIPFGEPRTYTIEDIYALPDGVRAELIDGRLYFMATSTRTHQLIAGEMHFAVASYIKARGGSCEVYMPPFGIFLNGDDSIYVEPDLSVICDTDKLDEKGCHGAPDWVVEIVSPSSTAHDQIRKLNKYKAAGVREYWVIRPDKRIVIVYEFVSPDPESAEDKVMLYFFDDEIPGIVFPDFRIRLSDVV